MPPGRSSTARSTARPRYRELVRALVLGADHEAVTSGRALATQTPGGTGGLRVAADLLHQTGAGQTLWMSEPTWPNHPQLFHAAGFRVRTYPYTDADGRRIDEAAMLEALGGASPGDVVLLHGACHNPTGVDPSPELWRRIGDLVEERRVLPLVDLAYQGFGDGLREDAAGPARAGPAGRRAAGVDVVLEDVLAVRGAGRRDARDRRLGVRRGRRPEPREGRDPHQLLEPAGPRRRHRPDDPGRRGPAPPLGGRARRDARPDQGQPPGARLGAGGPLDPGDWGGIATQRGMFALLGLSTPQVARLRDEHAVYVVGHGRINVAGFTSSNLRARSPTRSARCSPRPRRRARPRPASLGDEVARPRSILAQTSAGPGQVAVPVSASSASRGSAG